MPVTEEAQSAIASPPAVESAALLAAQRQALLRVLDSPVFRKNPRLSSLLQYLCNHAASPESSPPKEYTIATDVFGRSDKFDSSTDSIVRVEMHRLRKKLREFYENEGRDEPCQILLEAGHYRPQFQQVDIPSPAVETPSAVAVAPLPQTAVTPSRLWPLVTLCLAVLACLILVGAYLRGRSAAPASAISPAIAAADARDTVRILCGATHSNSEMNWEWGPDRYFSGGAAVLTANPLIFRTRQPAIYHSARVGDFSYDIPLHPGPHELRLHFAESTRNSQSPLDGSENIRLFNVFANGSILLQGFDIASEASLDTADIKVFRDVQPAHDGKLHLTFSHVTDAPLLNAIEIAPGHAGRLSPIRLATQPKPFTDSQGVLWSADDFFLQGRTLSHGQPENPGTTQEAVASIGDAERYGNFSYAIPVPPGRYTAKLHFFEGYWGPTLPGGGGVGSRVFDVYCNGQALWKTIDVFKEVGPMHDLVRTTSALQPNAQGKVVFSFMPVKNYAMVSAIELLDEAN